MKSKTMNVPFDAQTVHAAVEAARNGRLLCGSCVQKLESYDEMSQSDFCPSCQAAITSQLRMEAEGRLVEALIRMGLPPDSVQIAND